MQAVRSVASSSKLPPDVENPYSAVAAAYKVCFPGYRKQKHRVISTASRLGL